ncbi:MAG: Rieske 2Fe-2S domain-containing protein [Anaerolineales bacterium]|nr:Rieske 2Fe-2S domain-containing protein [Anaerolineales bacterium]
MSKTSPKLNRREFTAVVMTFLGSIMGAVVGFPLIGYIISPAIKAKKVDDWISLGNLEGYPIGEPTLFSFTRTEVNGWEQTTNSYGVFILRESETAVKVYSNVCTHLSCRVSWVAETQSFDCPCHDAKFNLDGEVVYGPPPRPLDQWAGEETKIDEEGNLLIHFTEG